MWTDLGIYTAIAAIFWAVSWVIMFQYKNKILASVLGILGTASIAFFTVQLWMFLGRPPLRTLGETRLWYSVVLSLVGTLLYMRWKYPLFMVYCHLLALLFLIINVYSPETHSKTLMPALQSPWFVPHVIVYMIAYACLAASFVSASAGIVNRLKHWSPQRCIAVADSMVYIGFGFLTMGLVFGGLWAKEAWGHYWTWDPKETWAFITWGVYLGYIHMKYRGITSTKISLIVLSISFIALLVCWFGINYLPAAQSSVHVYSRS